MKRSFIFLFAVLFSASVFPQSTEYSIHLSSGFFSFRGHSVQSSTYYNVINLGTHDGYTNNPYGSLNGFSYSIAFQAQRVTKWHFILGMQAGYESLSSKIKIDNVIPDLPNALNVSVIEDISTATDNSHTVLTNQFITVHPFLGYRANIIKGVETDLTVGADLAFCTKSEEKATVHSGYGNFDTKTSRNNPNMDNRLRVDLNNYYKHFGITIGYSYGYTNYEKEMVGSFAEAYSKMFRLGLIYKL